MAVNLAVSTFIRGSSQCKKVHRNFTNLIKSAQPNCINRATMGSSFLGGVRNSQAVARNPDAAEEDFDETNDFLMNLGAKTLLSAETINQNLAKAEYAVRGAILDRAMELEKDLAEGKKLPFDDVISCNIGNPQALMQQPITFNRQVLALIMCPSLFEQENLFPSDVVQRARDIVNGMPNVGAYSNTQGLPIVRNAIANFVQERDGYPCDPEEIFVTNGASEGVRNIMMSLVRDPQLGYNDGILCPIPQYPLYSAMSTILKGHLVPYYLDESKGWGLSRDELKRSLEQARWQGISVRALTVINPGNPTGQVLEESNMRDIVDFCVSEGIILLADEVYQENIYNPNIPFTSFKKVVGDMGYDGADKEESPELQLVSFHSVSKGFLGECGFRGGYFELHGIPSDVKAQLYKLASVSLCSNTTGQIMTGLMCNPPKEGSPSHELYETEKNDIIESLKRRATKLNKLLNSLEGVTSNSPDGSMYVFPQITLPEKAIDAALSVGQQPDAMYCMQMLEATGVIVVPGSGFGQKEGTWHFRTTMLPPEEKMDKVLARIEKFHTEFMQKYN